MKLNASTRASLKVVTMALLLSAGVYYGWRAWGDVQVNGYNPTPITPGSVTLVGIEGGSRYKIIVANEVAQLAEVTNHGTGKSSSMESDASGLHRIPIKEFLGSLRGDEKDLGYLVMAMNDLREDDLPATRVEWKAADIDKALKGDAALRQRLESDLHIGLDGTPPDTLRLRTLLNGIVLDIPVKVRVPLEGKESELTAMVQEAYMSKFATDIQKRINEKFNPPPEMITAWYRDAAIGLMEKRTPREDVAKALATKIGASRTATWAEKPQELLKISKVLLNDQQVKGATVRTYQSNDGKTFADLTIQLTDDGRMRLWKYSHGHQAFHLMFVVNGIPLAAPKINTELSSNEITIKQLPNESLAKEAADFINSLPNTKKT
ncbi:MAG: hypothetical protein KF857_09245 [Fimbriimonadaceae bacterium]|nr:hypothetical protein [Fimbriimonadaceae bacterium]